MARNDRIKSDTKAIELTKDELAKLERNIEVFKKEQNIALGILGGVAGMIIGTLLWASVSVIMKYQMGLVAVFVGFLVSLGVRFLGKGIGTEYSVIGGILSLLGCALGNVLTVSFFRWGWGLLSDFNFGEVLRLFVEKFQVYDLVFYALAIFIGVKFSARIITREELAKLP